MSTRPRRPRRVGRDFLVRGPSAQLMASMSHELRTPMNAILSFAYLGRHAQDTQKQRDYFSKIESAARVLLDVFDGVIDAPMRLVPEPVAPAVRPSELPSPPAAPEALVAGLRVLVVDDHETNLEIARELLESAQVSVTLAQSGVEAIARAAQGGLDAILMDLRMPGMDGIEATHRIRALQPQHARIPIVALTANVSTQDRHRCADAGMQGFVGKPIDVTELFATLARVTDRSASTARSRSPGRSAKAPGLSGPDHDYAAARARVATAPDLYARLAKRFLDYAEEWVRVATSLAQGQRWPEAARRVHTIRGIAGQVGALQVSRTAGQLERRFDACTPDPELLIQLVMAVQQSKACLTRFLDQGADGPAQVPNPTEIAQLRYALVTALEDGEDTAWDSYEALCAALPAADREHLAPVGACIASEEYAAALATLRAATLLTSPN